MALAINRLTRGAGARANRLLPQVPEYSPEPVPQTTELPVAAPQADIAPAVAQLGSNFPPTERVSTRLPLGSYVNQPTHSRYFPAPPTDPHLGEDYVIDSDSARQDERSHKANMALIRQHHGDYIPGIREMNDVDTETAFRKHIEDNLRWLYGLVPEHIRPRSKLWYEGAHRIARDMADEYGISHRQAAGMLAALSPQKDWFMNVELGRRLLHMNKHLQGQRVTPEMREAFDRFVATTGNVSKPNKDPEKFAKQLQNATDDAAEMRAVIDDEIGNKTLGELTDTYHKALFLRAYDEAHHDRNYYTISPEGLTGPKVVAPKSDKDRAFSWGNFGEIGKALAMLDEDSLENISRNLGTRHKVRNFYNNIIAPMFGVDVTGDTHAIAAGHLLPWGATAKQVDLGLGNGSKSTGTGAMGLYPYMVDSYRALAKDLGILPRELQSITWEAVRGLFSDTQKRNKDFVAAAHEIWASHGRGERNADEARAAILLHARGPAGGIAEPEWARSRAADYAAAWRPPGPREIPGTVGHDRGRRGAGARTGHPPALPEAAD